MENTSMKDLINKLFTFNVNYVYETIVNQFLNENGNYDSSVFWIINWNIIFDNERLGMNIIIIKMQFII